MTNPYKGISSVNLRDLRRTVEWYPVNKEDRPDGFVEIRKAICESPDSCFDRYEGSAVELTQEQAEAWPICGPCDFAACEILKMGKFSGF